MTGQTAGFGYALENAEKAAFGFGHGAVGARLLERWNVPPEIAVPVYCLHDPGSPKHITAMSAVIHLGDILAHRLKTDHGEDSQFLPAAAWAVEILRIPEDRLAVLEQDAKE